MNKKYFTDALNEQTIIDLTAEMLKEENMNKNMAKPRIKSMLFKIIPAAAMFALVIGLINILPGILNNNNNIDMPGAYIPREEEQTEPFVTQRNMFLPQFVEKTFFEEKIIAAIPEGRERDKIMAYYSEAFTKPTAAMFAENISNGIITTYSLSEGNANQFYELDKYITEREHGLPLEILIRYTDLTGNDLMQMYEDYGVIITETPDPYSHVRFGETRDILLLDIEWHTYETYLEEVIEGLGLNIRGELERIANNSWYSTRIINGKHFEYLAEGVFSRDTDDIQQFLDSDGYYRFEIYPSGGNLVYTDGDGETKIKKFTVTNSKRQYDRVLEEEIIPFCGELLEQGLLTREKYDYYTKTRGNLLDYYIGLYF
ncbi:MAG: hypothetical protein FWH10_00690 [Oscillospiraceae bacterium]|nr:hypothetical protein [Oscillospiraceae bacterium]